jgi:formylglycine-generating enzyme required for sulfatase activity
MPGSVAACVVFIATVVVTSAACLRQPANSELPSADVGVDTAGWPLRSASAAKLTGSNEMVCIREGPFTRGNDVEPFNRDEYPKKRVELPAFMIDKREVSVSDYEQCVRAGACDGSALGTTASSLRRGKPNEDCNAPRPDRKTHPINCVSWVDAYRYCAAVGKRLPTEAEWEKAARGATDDRQAPWGSLEELARGAPKANLSDRAAGRARPGLAIFEALDDGFVTTAPVGSFPAGASPDGVLDMLGNVAEWVFDAYDVDAYFRSPPGEPVVRGSLRVYRGHGWSSTPTIVRLTRRSAGFANDRDASTGFRCTRDAPRCDEGEVLPDGGHGRDGGEESR